MQLGTIGKTLIDRIRGARRIASAASPEVAQQAAKPAAAVEADPVEYLQVPVMAMPTIPPDQFAPVKYGWDYVRHAMMGLAIHRAAREGVPGDMAEVGVWRGDCARLIHGFAPDRRLYLFDTFDGFRDLVTKDLTDDTRFRDTDVDMVRQTVGPSQNVIIKRGIFPDTTAGLEGNRFAFVSLDLDTYDGILEGWRYFYPRMTVGGFIFVHDFNAAEYNSGPYRATTEFLSDKPEMVIEIPDQWGSALIRKV